MFSVDKVDKFINQGEIPIFHVNKLVEKYEWLSLGGRVRRI
jgi:hypothetical protein